MSDKEQVLQTLLDAANGEIGALTAECERLAAMAGGQVVASIGDDEQFLFLLNVVIGAGLESHACGGDFGSGDKMHAAEEKLIAYLDSRPTATKVIRNTKLDGVAGVSISEFDDKIDHIRDLLVQPTVYRAAAKAGQESINDALERLDELRVMCANSAAPVDGVAGVERDAVLAIILNAKAVIQRWDSPLWRQEVHTADFINQLRKSVDLAESAISPVAQPLAPSGAVTGLTVDEADFVLRVLANPGCKINDFAADGRWEKPESLGLVKFIGSWKWEPTGKLVELLRVALVAQPLAASAVPEGFALVPLKLTPEMIQRGGHANSEWLNDNAPIGESRYCMPMESVWKEFLAAAPSQQPAASPTDSKENK